MRKFHFSPDSKLYDQDTFYKAFMHDVLNARKLLIIESPFITKKRIRMLMPLFERLRRRGVEVIVNTRNPLDHEDGYVDQAAEAVSAMQKMGITVLYTAGHHRKLAIIDRRVVWEGSLNILSFSDSCEIMRRISSGKEAEVLINFLRLEQYVGA